MSFAAEGDHAVCVVTPQPSGPAQQAGVVRAEAQFAYFVLAQFQADVVIQWVAQGEAHQRAERLVAAANGQKFMEATPVQLLHVNAEFAAAITYELAEHQALAQLAVGQAEAVALLAKDFHLTLQALLDMQVGVLE